MLRPCERRARPTCRGKRSPQTNQEAVSEPCTEEPSPAARVNQPINNVDDDEDDDVEIITPHEGRMCWFRFVFSLFKTTVHRSNLHSGASDRCGGTTDVVGSSGLGNAGATRSCLRFDVPDIEYLASTCVHLNSIYDMRVLSNSVHDI